MNGIAGMGTKSLNIAVDVFLSVVTERHRMGKNTDITTSFFSPVVDLLVGGTLSIFPPKFSHMR